MKVSDIDGYYMSATGGIGNYTKCEARWIHRYVIGSPVLVSEKQYYMDFGTRNHKVEEPFWNMVIAWGKSIFTEQYLKEVTVEALEKRLTTLKMGLIYSHEDELVECVRNLSYLDAVEFFNLKKHFDGNVSQAYNYWVPLAMELDQKNHNKMTRVKLDNVKVIPEKYRKYRNKTNVLLIKDYKPGKKIISRNSEHGYKNSFGRQLAFYAINFVAYPYPDCRHVAGSYYRTKQYLVERISGHQTGPVEKKIKELWDKEEFSRKNNFFTYKKNDNWIYDECESFCPYRLSCRNTKKLWEINTIGEPYKLSKYCIRIKCKECEEKFIIPKFWLRRDGREKYKRCNKCKITEKKEEK